MLSSEQEAIVATLLQTSLGAPFLFEPDQYTVGGARQRPREPIDLVWWCRDTAFAINMTERHKQSAERADDHNFRQLRGWLRQWRHGRSLSGHNAVHVFNVPLADVQNLVLLSVIKVPDAHAWARPEPTPDDGPSTIISASLPESIFHQLARDGGSAIDLADLLLRLSTHAEPVTEAEAMEMLSEHRDAGIARVETKPIFSRDQGSSMEAVIAHQILQGARRFALAGPGTQDLLTSGLATFNDLDWEATGRLIRGLADLASGVNDVPFMAYGPATAAREMRLEPYNFVLVATDIGKAEGRDEILRLIKQRSEEWPEHPPLAIFAMLAGRPQATPSCMFMLQQQHGPTLTSQTLQAIDQ